MSEKTIGQEMLDKLSYKRRNVYEEATPEKIKVIYDYSEGYKKFLDDAKTEREATDAAIALAKANDRISEEISGKTIVKELYVKGRLVNIVVK